MFDLFLVHDLDLYELLVRGSLEEEAAAEAFERTLRFLPSGSALVLDLTQLGAASRPIMARIGIAAARSVLDRSFALVCVVEEDAMLDFLTSTELATCTMFAASSDEARRLVRQAEAA